MTSSTIQQKIFRKPSRKYSSPGFERRSTWGKSRDGIGHESTGGNKSESNSNSSNESYGTSTGSRSRPLSAYSEISQPALQNTDKELPSVLDDGQLSEVEEASETSTIGEERHEDNEDNEDNDDNEDSITINGEHANDSESTFRNEDEREDIMSSDSSSSNSLRHKSSFKSTFDAQSIASTTDQSFVSARETIETMSFHSTPSTVDIHEDGEKDVSTVSSASQYSQSSANEDESEALNAANALPDVQVDDRPKNVDSPENFDSAKSFESPKDSKAKSSADTSPANTVVDSIFDSTQISYNGSPSTEFNSVVSATTTPKQSPAQPATPRKRNISTNSEASTVRASMTKNLPVVPPKRERRRVVSTPSRNSEVNFRQLSNDTSSTKPSPDRPQSRLILPSEFVKLRKDTPASSVVSESTKYPKSNTTSTTSKLPRSNGMSATSRTRSWTVGAVQSHKPSVKRPTTNIDHMLPNDALGIERSMLSISVTSGAAEKLAKSNRSIIGKRKSVSWSGARSRNYTQLYKPMINLGLNSHFKPPQKLDPHSVLIRVHSTALDNFDALTLMRGTKTHNNSQSHMEAPPGPEYGFIPGRMALGQVVEVGWKVKNIHRQEWTWTLLSTEKSGCLSEYIVVNRNRVSQAPIQKAGQDISKFSTIPLKAFAAQTLSNSHMSQLRQGSRILVLAGNSNPYNSVSTYIIEELKQRNCQIFVQTTSHEDFNYGVGVYELSGTVKEIASDQLEGSFEMVIDARLCFDETENSQALESCRRVLCRDGAFITLIPDIIDVDNAKPIRTQSRWRHILRILSMRFRKQAQTKRVQRVVLGVAGEDDVDSASGMDVRDMLDEIARKVNTGVYSTFLNDKSQINAYQLENATSAFHTVGFNERGSHITNQPLSDYAVVRMRS